MEARSRSPCNFRPAAITFANSCAMMKFANAGFSFFDVHDVKHDFTVSDILKNVWWAGIKGRTLTRAQFNCLTVH